MAFLMYEAHWPVYYSGMSGTFSLFSKKLFSRLFSNFFSKWPTSTAINEKDWKTLKNKYVVENEDMKQCFSFICAYKNYFRAIKQTVYRNKAKKNALTLKLLYLFSWYMDWVHCNSCFVQPGSSSKKFFLTSCGHVFCQDCIQGTFSG